MPDDAHRSTRHTPLAALLLLGDGRLPTGGHVHSGGVEAAVARGAIRGEDGLRAFIEGRLHTAGVQDATLAAATRARLVTAAAPHRPHVLRRLDAEVDARLPVGPLRDASRRQGRQLVRVADRCWPDPVFADVQEASPAGPHQAVAIGVVGVAVGLDADEVAALAVHHLVTTLAQAGLRLLGLDPFAVAAMTAALAEPIGEVVDAAVRHADGPLSELPAPAAPLTEIAALDHARLDPRLFAT